MQFSPRDIVVLFSGFLGILLAAYLLRHPGTNKRASQWLASFLLLQGLLLLVTVFLYRHILYLHWEQTFRGLFYLESTLLALDGIFLYAYCSVLLLKRSFTWQKLLIHLGLTSIAVAVSLYIYTQSDVMSYFNPTASDRSVSTGLGYCLMQAVRAGYGLLCLQLLGRYRARMSQQFSNLQQRDVTWVFSVIKGFAAYRIGWLLFHGYFTAAAFYSWNMLDYKWWVGGGLFLLDFSWLIMNIGLLYFGLKYSPGFLSLAYDQPSASPTRPEVDHALIQKLETSMTESRLFADPDLRLDDLAAKLRCPTRTVSATINEHYQTNFCEFINRYRIDEAKRLLGNEKRMSVLDISLEVGFNSKSAFNRAFKNSTAMTPLAYRKQIQSDNLEIPA